MPELSVKRHGITPHVRDLPATVVLIVQPMTMDRIGKEVAMEDEVPLRIDSLNHAFGVFKPCLRFRSHEREEPECTIEFKAIADFDPERILKPAVSNGLGELQANVDFLYRLKECWQKPSARRAWNAAAYRQQLLALQSALMTELTTLSLKMAERDIRAEDGTNRTFAELLSTYGTVRFDLLDTFKELDPVFSSAHMDLRSSLSPERAHTLLKRVNSLGMLLSANENHDATLTSIDSHIAQGEEKRDSILAQIFEVIRPIEESYQQIRLFFENAKGDPRKAQDPIELFIVNADPKGIRNRNSTTIAAIKHVIAQRNDNFEFRDDVSTLVVPGLLPQDVREELEQLASAFGVLLVGDIRDEDSFTSFTGQLQSGQIYEFLTRPNGGHCSDVVTLGYLKVRSNYWFENRSGNWDGLYVPGSVSFAGAFARMDSQGGISQGPVGAKLGSVKGPVNARFALRITEISQLSFQRHIVPIIRDADDRLSFYVCRSIAEGAQDLPEYTLPFRILRNIGKRIQARLTEVAGAVLTRDFIDREIETPLVDMLEVEKKKGNIDSYSISVDKSQAKRIEGVCDIQIRVKPLALLEEIDLQINIPSFRPQWKK